MNVPQGGVVSEETPAMPEFVTTLAPIEQQVGQQVLAALQHPETVAVLTTVAMGDDGHQRIVSAGLDSVRLEEVRELLISAKEVDTNRVRCVGFHCRVREQEIQSEPNAASGGGS